MASNLKPCRQFRTPEGCRYGDSCKFSHDTSGTQRPARVSSDQKSDSAANKLFKDWTFLIPRASKMRPFDAGPLGSRLPAFFSSALSLVSTDVDTRQGVVTRLAEEGGLHRIKELSLNVEDCEGQSDALCLKVFHDQVVPFLKTISYEDVDSSLVLESHLATILNFLFGVSGRRAVLVFSLASKVIGTGLDDPTLAPYDVGQALEATCVVFTRIVDLKGPGAVPEEFLHILGVFAHSFERLAASNIQAPHRAGSMLTRASRRLNTSRGIYAPSGAPKASFAKPTFHLKKDGPGDLSSEGPRHDNDFQDIRRIEIMPTTSEISCRRAEYLPGIDSSTWHLQGRDGSLDRQFRLLREDTVGQLRDAVRQEIEREDTQSIDQASKSRYKQVALRHVYHNAALRTIELLEREGLALTYQLAQPAALREKSTAERSAWWSTSNRLSEGALVCLLDSRKSVIFCSVVSNGMSTERPGSNKNSTTSKVMPSNLNLYQDKKHAYVALSPINCSHESVGCLLEHYAKTDAPRSEKLIEFPGILVPSFYPTLQALQDRTGKEDLPFEGLWNMATEGPDETGVPHYAKGNGFRFDLSTLLSDGPNLEFEPAEVFDSSALQARTSLDDAQAKSLINALQRKVALIQGPPGTGKSFTGVALIKVLLANASRATIGPVLTVCYTNHALDQLLEHLLDHGVDQIVRIGSRSKTERLDDLNLNRISRDAEKTPMEKRTLYNAFETIKGEREKINTLFDFYLRAGGIGTIKHHLQSRHPQHYAELFGDDGLDADGFQRVSRKKGNELNLWLHGGKDMKRSGSISRSVDTLHKVRLADMSQEERKTLHASWISEYQLHTQQKALHLLTEYDKAKRNRDNVHNDLDIRCLKQAKVVGLTTSGLARVQSMLGRLNSKVLLCEEAGEILEAHTLATLLPSIEHMILIGDHQQLRPQINNYDLQKVNPRGEQYSLDVSLFERLIEPPSRSAVRIPFDTLTTQRRMHPCISSLIRPNSYALLQDHVSVENYPEVVGMRRRLFWYDHDQVEDAADQHISTNKSHTNAFEAEMTCALVEHIVKQGSYAKSDVAVLTPYLGQMRKLRQGLSRSFAIAINERDHAEAQAKGIALEPSVEQQVSSTQRSLGEAIRLATVDNFQGEEAQVVVISLVRCNEHNKCGFLSTANRINVLLSRAQHGMYIIGCTSTYRHVPYWENAISQFEAADNVGRKFELQCPRHPETAIEVATPDDFAVLAPEGGCKLKCPKRLTCGHACITSCHSEAMHKAVRCLEPCPRQMPGCEDHSCPNVCGDACPPRCKKNVKDVNLPCGHVHTLQCWEAQDPATARCPTEVEESGLACGHTIKIKCYQSKVKESIRCTADCGATLPCGHLCKTACHKCEGTTNATESPEHGSCQQICGRPYKLCNHSCQAMCHPNKECGLCPQKCERRCVHSACDRLCHQPCAPCAEETCSASCPHSVCDMPCSVPCNWIPCSKRCGKMLECGHRCPTLCGEPCPDVKFCQICCSEGIKTMPVDFLEYKAYSEVDLDENPCVIPRCGHILTQESMDGVFDMTKYYSFDARGAITGIIDASVPFSDQDDMKSCPTCRGSLRELSRYGRLVRRALLDESTKRLVSWAQQDYLSLEQKFEDIEKSLTTSAKAFTIKGSLLLNGTAEDQFKAVAAATVYRQGTAKAMSFRSKVKDFLLKISAEEQPYHRVSDMVKFCRRRKGIEAANLPNEIGTVQLRHSVLTTALLLRVDLCILGTAVASFLTAKASPRNANNELLMDLSHNRSTCVSLVEEAKKAFQPSVEADGHTLFALYAALEASNVSDERTGEGKSGSSTGAALPSSQALREQGMSHVAEAESICKRRPSETRGVVAEIAKAKDALQRLSSFSVVTSEERREVLKAMHSELRGTGHWYTCQNGHPFSIGECGMPMQQARCPQCGSAIGGRSHQVAEGVQRAQAFDDEIRNMTTGMAGMRVAR